MPYDDFLNHLLWLLLIVRIKLLHKHEIASNHAVLVLHTIAYYSNKFETSFGNVQSSIRYYKWKIEINWQFSSTFSRVLTRKNAW